MSEIQRASGAVGTLSGLRHERVPLQRKIQNLKSTLYVTAKKRNVGFSRFTMGILLAVYIEVRNESYFVLRLYLTVSLKFGDGKLCPNNLLNLHIRSYTVASNPFPIRPSRLFQLHP